LAATTLSLAPSLSLAPAPLRASSLPLRTRRARALEGARVGTRAMYLAAACPSAHPPCGSSAPPPVAPPYAAAPGPYPYAGGKGPLGESWHELAVSKLPPDAAAAPGRLSPNCCCCIFKRNSASFCLCIDVRAAYAPTAPVLESVCLSYLGATQTHLGAAVAHSTHSCRSPQHFRDYAAAEIATMLPAALSSHSEQRGAAQGYTRP